mmetsp:Transcript_18828/g.52507  ORF Transcript_18828/g.52507 Transcript_18828/m.52507 type:complete len:323 (+) Transcript_18828:523-1491(+)
MEPAQGGINPRDPLNTTHCTTMKHFSFRSRPYVSKPLSTSGVYRHVTFKPLVAEHDHPPSLRRITTPTTPRTAAPPKAAAEAAEAHQETPMSLLKRNLGEMEDLVRRVKIRASEREINQGEPAVEHEADRLSDVKKEALERLQDVAKHEPKSMNDKYNYDYMERKQVPKYPFMSTAPTPTSQEQSAARHGGAWQRQGRRFCCLAAVWLAYSVGYKPESGKNGAAARLLDGAITQQLGNDVLRRTWKITPSHPFIYIAPSTPSRDPTCMVGRPKKEKQKLFEKFTRPYMAAGEQGLSQAVYHGVRFNQTPCEFVGPEDDEHVL